MTPEINFNNPYSRDEFLPFLEWFLPDDFKVTKEKITDLNFTVKYTEDVTKLGTCESLKLDVYEITHASNHDARVGIAQDAFRLMLYKSYYNRALVIFKPVNSNKYRFSLLQIEAEQAENSSRITRSFSNPRRYSFQLGEGAHVKTPEQFLLGKGKLKPVKDDIFKDLQDRFSVEVLTKQFYKELSNWYFWAIKNVSFPNDIDDDTDNEDYNEENVIRLITRLIFVWFLKEKKLIHNDLFDEDFLVGILKKFNSTSTEQDNYYRAVLQNLFFATLNQEVDQRGFAADEGYLINRNNFSIKSLYRYEKDFKDENTEHIMDLFKQIPFLNGGLFECLDRKIKDGRTYYWDGFSRNKKHQARIPNNLFFEKGKIVDLSQEYNDKKMSSVQVTGIIEILKKYNFTVEENTPIEIEVALDPELLGKVFENLLGSYNPETQETARNQTGSFYTPREVVNFMVNESLIAYYLKNIPDIEEEILRNLLSYDDNEVIISDEQRKSIIEYTFKSKILDPACGSGAFPMGILQQMVHILGKLDYKNDYWYQLILDQAVDEIGKLVDGDDLEQKQNEIDSIFDKKFNNPDYARKLYLIENCIYGVDKQSIAVQISKLRFFISLLCEQKPNKDYTKNLGIRPLPNLETKFVAADTLKSIEKEEDDFKYLKDDTIKKLTDRLQDIRSRQFSVTNVKQKNKLREDDKEVRKDIVNEVTRLYKYHADENLGNYKKELFKTKKELEILNARQDQIAESLDLFGNKTGLKINTTQQKRNELNNRIKNLKSVIEKGSDYSRLNSVVRLAQQLTSWNPYDQNHHSDFFDPEWMFGLTTGFDIVIGNPPYIQLQNNGGELAKLYENESYKTFKRTGDIYCLFYERGWQLLKEGGHLCYITSNKWMRAGYGEETREFFTNKTNPIKLIDFGGTKIFESATVDTNILLFAKENNTFSTQACLIKNGEINNLSDYFKQNATISSFKENKSWVILTPIEKQIKEKIEQIGTPLKEWDIQINYGIKTGFNEAFIINGEKRKELIEQDPKSAEIIRPILRGRDIKRFDYDFADLWLINTHNGVKEKGVKPINIDDYPALKEHLNKYYNQLEKRQDKGDTPYNLRNCAYMEDFSKQKIAWNRIAKEKVFSLVSEGIYIQDSMHFFTGNNLKYICAFLNSKLFSWLLYIKIGEAVGGNAGNSDNIKNLKIPEPGNDKSLLILIDKLFNESDKNIIHEIDFQLNHKIYSLYNLSDDEIKYIEAF